MSRSVRGMVAVCVAVLVGACSTPPTRDLPPLPQAWFAPVSTAPADPDALAAWWRVFDDPVLDALIQAALSRNLDVQSALAEIGVARAQLRTANAALRPVVEGTAQGSRQWLDLRGIEDTPIDDVLDTGGNARLDNWQSTLQASWEIDLFGANRLRRDAGALQLGAAQAQLVATRLAVASNLAQGYVQARALLGQLRILDESVEAARGFERVAQAHFRLGEASRLDVESAAAQRARTEARRGELEAGLAETTFALDTLTDRRPGTARTVMGDGDRVPVAEVDIRAGQPVDLLRRRPDVIAAAAQLDAVERNALASRRDLFPRLGLNAAYGRSGLALGGISSASLSRNVGAQLSFPWLDFGATRAAIMDADAQADLGFVGLRQAIATALEEVEVAAAQVSARAGQRRAGTEAVRRSTETVRIARWTYEVGVAGLADVLEAQDGLLQARLDLLETERALATAQVALYAALGGGWLRDPDEARSGVHAVDRELQRNPVPDRIRAADAPGP